MPMGRDLPSRTVQVKAQGLLSPNGITRLFTFVVEDHEGNQRDVECELPPEFGDDIERIQPRSPRVLNGGPPSVR